MDTQGVASSVSYDEAPVVEVTVGDVQYRVDAGRGSAVAISSRAAGTWAWSFVVEGRFDGTRLRARVLGFEVIKALTEGLVQAARAQSE